MRFCPFLRFFKEHRKKEKGPTMSISQVSLSRSQEWPSECTMVEIIVKDDSVNNTFLKNYCRQLKIKFVKVVTLQLFLFWKRFIITENKDPQFFVSLKRVLPDILKQKF